MYKDVNDFVEPKDLNDTLRKNWVTPKVNKDTLIDYWIMSPCNALLADKEDEDEWLCK